MSATSTPDTMLDGAALVRIHVDGPHAIQALPAMNPPWELTVALGGPELLVHHDELSRRGYRIVDVADEPAARNQLDVFVSAAFRASEAATWRTLHALAERVFDLRMGPVRLLLARQVAHHLGARGMTA